MEPHIYTYTYTYVYSDLGGPTPGCRFQFHAGQIQSGDRLPCKHVLEGLELKLWFDRAGPVFPGKLDYTTSTENQKKFVSPTSMVNCSPLPW